MFSTLYYNSYTGYLLHRKSNTGTSLASTRRSINTGLLRPKILGLRPDCHQWRADLFSDLLESKCTFPILLPVSVFSEAV